MLHDVGSPTLRGCPEFIVIAIPIVSGRRSNPTPRPFTLFRVTSGQWDCFVLATLVLAMTAPFVIASEAWQSLSEALHSVQGDKWAMGLLRPRYARPRNDREGIAMTGKNRNDRALAMLFLDSLDWREILNSKHQILNNSKVQMLQVPNCAAMQRLLPLQRLNWCKMAR